MKVINQSLNITTENDLCRAGNSGLAVQGTLCPVAQLFEGTFKFFRGRYFALLPEFFRALSKFLGAVIYTSI